MYVAPAWVFIDSLWPVAPEDGRCSTHDNVLHGTCFACPYLSVLCFSSIAAWLARAIHVGWGVCFAGQRLPPISRTEKHTALADARTQARFRFGLSQSSDSTNRDFPSSWCSLLASLALLQRGSPLLQFCVIARYCPSVESAVGST